MTALQLHSFDVTSIGRQTNSQKATTPSYSFGTGSRDVARLKVFLSQKQEKVRSVINSPGPVYQVPSSVGNGPRWGFGQDEQRKHGSNRYPDSSVDLTCATVDSQQVKYSGTPSVNFGTEVRGSHKNAEILRTNPDLMLGMESPGALEYTPQEGRVLNQPPSYSFGPPEDKTPAKPVNRLSLAPGSTPRHVGPGSHSLPPGIGQQPQSARPSGPRWSFGGGNSKRSKPLSARENGPLLDTEQNYSSIGKQVVSTLKSSTASGFGRSTRENRARTAMCMTGLDHGPAGGMGKMNFHIDLPRTAPASTLSKPGL
eukprot:TRINITY_DN9103_c0_g1_i1.p1 TRINITY_DN9103_c0_g1~~TRINITY_DN9103_c0_g1_i1.p1  ORF type:complete len:312 (+),score=44.73 TRINITY_DN9103_c0_g1_i1:105-1040(+)